MTYPIPQNAYLVSSGTGTLYPTVVLDRDPTAFDLSGPSGQKFQPTQRWVNRLTQKEWFLLNFTTSTGDYQANWVQIAGGSSTTETLTGNSGGAVGPTANNINVVGDGTSINVVGNPGTSTLTISAVNTGVVETLTGNTGGSISPTAGNINTAGTGSITIAGSGSTLTTELTGLTNHNVLVGAGTATITNVAPSATSGIPLISQGSSSDPAFGTAVVAGGGTGDTSFTAYAVITGGTTSTGVLQNVSGVGTSGQILTSAGAASLPAWQGGLNTWTPSVSFGGVAAAGWTYSTQFAFYYVVGSMVFININLIVSATSGTPAGQAGVTTLPFAINSSTGLAPTFTGSFFDFTGTGGSTYVYAVGTPGSTNLTLLFSDITAAGPSAPVYTNFQAGTGFQLSGWYPL